MQVDKGVLMLRICWVFPMTGNLIRPFYDFINAVSFMEIRENPCWELNPPSLNFDLVVDGGFKCQAVAGSF